MIKIAIIGATGYSGQELLRLLIQHPRAEIKYLTSRSYVGQKIGEIYKYFATADLGAAEVCVEQDIEKFSKECDLIFIALPSGFASKKVTKEILDNSKVIDLGADFRFKDASLYKEWYKMEHFGKMLLPEAIYGLPELYREEIKNARLIANPGCYSTCSILSLLPFVEAEVIDSSSIIINAASGTSGAGRGLATSNLFCETNENYKAYKIASHRHTGEIEQILKLDVPLVFTPHILPTNRGILTTIYADLKVDMTVSDLKKIAEKYYEGEQFVRILEGSDSAEIRWIKGSNYFDMNVFKDARTNKLIITSALDNLVKGAAGQAIQNMNLMFGLAENTGLNNLGVFP